MAAVHLGRDRYKKTPCGFAFVEYRHRIDALAAVAHLTGTMLDGLPIRVELDARFKPGQEYGRGQSGGQVRDEGGGARKRRRDAGGKGEPARFRARWESPAESRGVPDGAGEEPPLTARARRRPRVVVGRDGRLSVWGCGKTTSWFASFDGLFDLLMHEIA